MMVNVVWLLPFLLISHPVSHFKELGDFLGESIDVLSLRYNLLFDVFVLNASSKGIFIDFFLNRFEVEHVLERFVFNKFLDERQLSLGSCTCLR